MPEVLDVERRINQAEIGQLMQAFNWLIPYTPQESNGAWADEFVLCDGRHGSYHFGFANSIDFGELSSYEDEKEEPVLRYNLDVFRVDRDKGAYFKKYPELRPIDDDEPCEHENFAAYMSFEPEIGAESSYSYSEFGDDCADTREITVEGLARAIGILGQIRKTKILIEEAKAEELDEGSQS